MVSETRPGGIFCLPWTCNVIVFENISGHFAPYLVTTDQAHLKVDWDHTVYKLSTCKSKIVASRSIFQRKISNPVVNTTRRILQNVSYQSARTFTYIRVISCFLEQRKHFHNAFSRHVVFDSKAHFHVVFSRLVMAAKSV